MGWGALVTTALLGLENGQLPSVVLEQLEARGVRIKSDPSVVLLEGAAVFWQMQKSGFLLPNFIGNLPEKASLSEEKFCTPAAGFYLEGMLNGLYKKALPEFFYFLRQKNEILLPELLPLVFRSALRNKTLWNIVHPHIGERGKWLLRQNPDWNALVKRKVENPDAFEYLESSKDPEEFAYRCHPEKLREIQEFYEQYGNNRDWQTETVLKIIAFRTNMLNALSQ